MNIWLLHPTAGGPELGRHWRPYWLADAWIRLGHRPVVICANSHHLMAGETRPPGPQRISDVDFWFVKALRYRNNSLGRFGNNVSFGLQFSLDARAISEQFGTPDLVIASTPHLFYLSAARRIARRFKAKFWVEMRDLWPESITALGLAPAWHPIVKVIGWQARYAYRHADRLISLLGGAEAHMNSRGLPFGRFVWVPNGVSEAEIKSALEPQEVGQAILERMNRMKAEDKRIVLYAGAMGPPNAIEVVIDAAALLATTNPEVHFILIGSGISREKLQQQAINLPNVEFMDEVERPIAHVMLRASDCAVISFHANALYEHGISANKLFDYCLFAPRSVIACDPMALVGLEDLVTLRCMPDKPAMLANALVSALNSPERPVDRRIAAVEQFSYARLAERYLA